MTFSLVSFLILVVSCGLFSALGTIFSGYSSGNEWFGNLRLLFTLAICVFLSILNPGVAFVFLIVVAFVGGASRAGSLNEMRHDDPTSRPVLVFVFAPLLALAGAALGLSALYWLLAFLFAHFPLPFELPYSAVSSVFALLLQKPLWLWEFYAVAAYLSIMCGLVAKLYLSAPKPVASSYFSPYRATTVKPDAYGKDDD